MGQHVVLLIAWQDVGGSDEIHSSFNSNTWFVPVSKSSGANASAIPVKLHA